VYFHVITDGSTGRLSRSTVRDQINVLNLSFGGFYGGVDTGSCFTLAGLDFTDNAEWFAYQVLDRVVIHYGSVPGGSIEGFNLGLHGGARGGSLAAASAYLQGMQEQFLHWRIEVGY